MVAGRSLFIWTLCCILAGAVFLAYSFAALAAGRGEIVLPLDDVYIHFQYARQMANGQPYVYNPGQPSTSGATSFLYPYVLTFGYLIGFQGLNLGLWAMIVGALALAASLWLVYRLALAFEAPRWLALAAALLFGLTGAIQWHFMSGMETGLMILFTLATLYAVVTGRPRLFVLAASLMALTRPEGGPLAVIAVVMMVVQFCVGAIRESPLRWQWLWLLIPILALFVQPLVNLLVTGSAVATGNAAKSIFGMVPFYWDVVIGRIAENFVRMWAEFFTGVSPREGLYVPYGVGLLAMIALVVSIILRDRWPVSLMVILWLLAGTAAIATLDTAFWHFKRYQMPLMALFFPLAAWGIVQIWMLVRATHESPLRYAMYGLVAAGCVLGLTTSAAFMHHFALNVNYVYLQPLQMANWLRENTPEDALIAVHDVGMMRYMGGRTTLDMVGLTTPGAAAYWRNGPGSIAEFLIQERPDYIASYGEGHGLGLGMIAQTRIYGDPLAEFPVVLDDHYNVALAAEKQGIYQPRLQDSQYLWNWVNKRASQWGTQFLLRDSGINLVDEVDVANLVSENTHSYTWNNSQSESGFPTLFFELDSIDCGTHWEPCRSADGGRYLNGVERFNLFTQPDMDLVLTTRVHPVAGATLKIYANNHYVDENVIPAMPGHWLEISTLIPAELITGTTTEIRIEPGGQYLPFHHWARQGNFEMQLWEYDLQQEDPSEIADYQDGSFKFLLGSVFIDEYSPEQPFPLVVRNYLQSDGSAEGDYRFFVHLYDDVNQPPVAQYDDYPGNGTLPPGNWLPGVFGNTVVVDLSDTPPGTYQLAIGFYDPYTGERLMPESEVYEVSADGRLWLGEVEVPE